LSSLKRNGTTDASDVMCRQCAVFIDYLSLIEISGAQPYKHKHIVDANRQQKCANYGHVSTHPGEW